MSPENGWMRGSAVAIQPDGKIVAAGSGGYFDEEVRRSDFAVARLNPDGSTDAGFGVGGLTFADFGGWGVIDIASAVALQLDGRIVVGGTGGVSPPRYFSLARFTSGGVLDPTFGQGGRWSPPSPSAGPRGTAN